MKKLLILAPLVALFASCKSTTVVEAPKTPPPIHTTNIVPVPSPTMTRESTTIRSTEIPVTRTRTSTTTIVP